ncbi:nitroreductase family protein [Clostridium minihomine]|uniref:nitroreductase family protein n=1 Tax=Clostridium minihomine TaxID=2045012 RepID=UPI000C7715D2|nr:nitroreductase family protein [Clostridium minihomine]
MNAVLKNIITRRSIRSFQDKQVLAEDLDLILLAGSYAPSGRGLQSWKFTAVQNPQVLGKINETIRLALREVTPGPETHPYVVRLIEKAKREDSEFLFHAPTYLIVSNEVKNVNSMADSALALGNMMLAAHSLGLGSCWLNHLPNLPPTQRVRSLLTELNIPETHKVFGTLALGYPKDTPRAAERKDVIHIIR